MADPHLVECEIIPFRLNAQLNKFNADVGARGRLFRDRGGQQQHLHDVTPTNNGRAPDPAAQPNIATRLIFRAHLTPSEAEQGCSSGSGTMRTHPQVRVTADQRRLLRSDQS